MPFGLALILALDQRIEWQFPLLVVLAVYTVYRVPGTRWHPGKATATMLLACGFLAINSLASLTDPTGLSPSWPAAPLRVGIFYVSLIALATIASAPRFDGEAVFRTLEWLFCLKWGIAAFEAYFVLQTGEPRERPFFNIILSSDSLLGLRLTSSYDVLFALFALAPRKPVRRLSLLAAAIVLTETRALMLLGVFFLVWRLVRDRSPWALAAGLAIPLAGAIGAMSVLVESVDAETRLTQFEGSSLDDKWEQIHAVGPLILSPYLLTGRGLGASLPGIIRDEARPYSYEAQTPVLLWQGGLLFYAAHLFILWIYGGRYRLAAIIVVLGLGILNPTLFSLSSAFLIVVLGRVASSPNHANPQPKFRRSALHT